MKKFILLLFVLLPLVACQNSEKETEPAAAEEGHDHGSLPILVFADGMEIFAEADQPFVSHQVALRAHLTFLEGYVPAEKGILYASLTLAGKADKWVALELLQPGIYTGQVAPNFSGSGQFSFKYVEEELEVIFVQPNVLVYSHGEEAPEGEHVDGDFFTKEQAWKTAFGLLELKRDTFSAAIHCAGEIIVAPEALAQVLAPVAGKILYANHKARMGQKVKRGELLYTVLPEGLGDENIGIQLESLKAKYQVAEKVYNRKRKLHEQGAVATKDVEVAEENYTVSKKKYLTLKNRYTGKGVSVQSPVSGSINAVYIGAGGFVESGTTVIEVLESNNKLLRANAPVSLAHLLGEVNAASVKLPGSRVATSIHELGGKLISTKPSIAPGTSQVPLFFSGDFGGTLPGTFVDVWLERGEVANAIMVPKSALMEAYGSYSVYLQVEGETYEKRSIELGGYNGVNYQVIKGLQEGDVIVSIGAMAIKVANSLGAPPAHSH